MRDKVDELKQVLKAKKDAHSPSREGSDAAEAKPQGGREQEPRPDSSEAELQKAKEQAQENQEKYLRLYAEFENFRKRAQKDKEEFSRYAHEQVIKELLPIMDDFERALSHAESAKDVKSLVDGIKMVEKQMAGVLERFGLKSFTSLGEAFNPHVHEAMAHQNSSTYPPDTVMAEYRKGYNLNGKLLRPALVAVSKGAGEEEAPENMAGEAQIQKPTRH